MVERYYGCLSRRVTEDGGMLRTGLEFEVVKAEDLDPFLEGEKKETAVSKKQEEVLDIFREYGIAQEEFRKRKVSYLGEAGFRMLVVFFDNIEYARYQYENWYEVRLSKNKLELSGKLHECSIYDWGDGDDVEINAYCGLGVLPPEQTSILKSLYRPYIPEESNLQTGGNLGGIAAGTSFLRIRFYCVGAALCAELYDTNSNVVAFFDLGTKVSRSIYTQSQYAAVSLSRATILNHLRLIQSTGQVTIFISHWHDDHCNALGLYDRLYGNVKNLVNGTEWYVPESVMPIFTKLQHLIPAASFHVYQRFRPQPPVNVNLNSNIRVGKINCMSDPHPHHQGLYVTVRLHNGKNVLLVGDTTYEGIPQKIRTNDDAGYECLQVCHHGGNYFLAPADQNPGIATLFIPTPAPVGACSVYSADGNRYGHPDPFYVEHHHGVGYEAVNECQLQLLAANKHYFVDFC